jgi:hydroxypyruvate isomerase
VKKINCLAGIKPAAVSDEQARATLVANLRYAALKLGQHGIDLLIEPINTFDIPGFFVSTTAHGVALLDEVGAANAYIQYDVYHMQRMEGELAGTLNRYLARIGHIQIADNPGRNEPGTGEIAYAFLFAHLKRIGWKGAIGCEYKPAAATEAGLGWRQQLAQ